MARAKAGRNGTEVQFVDQRDDSPTADVPGVVSQKLAHLWADLDLAGLLDQEALDQLPLAERQECRALWGEIDVLIRRAQTITAQDGFRGDGSS